MVDLPTTRQAWRIVDQGKPEDVLVLEEIPLPKLQRGEVLIKVQAAALNPVDYKLMKFLPNFITSRPSIVGADFAGVVADTDGSEFTNGEAVYGWNPMSIRKASEGAVAEYIKVPAERVVRISNNTPATEVAGTCLAGLTAYQGLKVGEMQEGQSVFINGGSSSVGRFAIQIAKAKGCRVTVSCSTSKIETMKSLGADEVVDYTAGPLHRQLIERNFSPKFHIFFETIGLPEIDLFANSTAYLAPGGIFVSVGPHGPTLFDRKALITSFRCLFQPTWLGGTPRKFKLFSVLPNRRDLEALSEIIAEGKVKCPVDSIFPFKDTVKAFTHLQTGKANGKVVISIPK